MLILVYPGKINAISLILIQLESTNLDFPYMGKVVEIVTEYVYGSLL